ncbi:MAG: nucleotidyltransferase [Actinomycetota bacterium]|nr:nucleotidyltransferase [Actinomycetota bacterium]
MKLIKYFDAFLEDTVNLNPSRMELLETRTTAITNFLKEDEVFGPVVKAAIPQGSFAQKTIIRPRSDGHFDADLLLHLDQVPSWDASEYVGKLYTALGRSPIYKEMRHRRTRCVYVDYADEFHVDLVPYTEIDSGGYITNNKTNCFELTDPKGFTGWLKDQNRTANGHLLKVIRLLKYIRDITWGLNVTSLILTALVGERVSQFAALSNPGCYADVPTTLKTVVGALDDYLQQNYYLPAITDPGGTGDRFDQRWNQDGYASFRTRFHTLRAKVDAAFDADGADASIAAWRVVFGENFRAPATTPTSGAGRGALVVIEGKALPVTERFLDRDLGIPCVQNGHAVRLVGRVTPKEGFRHYRLPDNGNRVGKGRSLRFEIESCTVPEPYEVYWKVRNTGAEAQRAGSLRGEIREGGRTHRESTRYRGPHWVECYIVKHGRCLARARQPVNVT